MQINHSQFSTSARTSRFGSGGVVLRSATALTDEEIIRSAPSVFATEKHDSRSDRFTFIPTASILAGMRKAGFFPHEIRQGGSRDEDKRGFTKHMIRFRRDEALKVGDSVQEVILLNAHDGTSSYQLLHGWFRMVCRNGLIVAEAGTEMCGVRVPHKGDILGQVIDGAYTVLNEGQQQAARIERMRALDLRRDEQHAFAEAAAALRFEDGKVPVKPEQIVQAHREADVGNSLWLTFNRAQENLVRGGLSYIGERRDGTTGRVQRVRNHTRPVNGIDGNVSLNRALWVLSERMAELKAA